VPHKAKNETGANKTDLDVVYSSDTNMTVAELSVSVKPVTLPAPDYTLTGGGTHTVTLVLNGTFPPGAEVDVTITFKQEEANKVQVQSKWTPPGSPDDIPVLGFEVDESGNYTLFNDSEFDIEMSNIVIDFNVSFRPNEELAALLAVADPTPGKGLIVVPAAASTLLLGSIPIPMASYFYSQFNARFVPVQGAPPSTAVVFHGHEGVVHMAQVDSFSCGFELELSTEFGIETLTLTGPMTVILDMGDVGDPDGDNLESVRTEIQAMELSGQSSLGPVTIRLRDDHQSPFQASVGEVEENTNNIPGVVDIVPFAASGSATASSDVFIEIEIPNIGLNGHNETPLHILGTVTSYPPDTGEAYCGVAKVPLFSDQSVSLPLTHIVSACLTLNRLEPPIVGDNTCQTAGANTGIACSTDADCTEPAECGLKNRYLSVTPTNQATATSIRVRVLTAPQFPAIVGHVFYAGPEQSIPNSPAAALRGAPLQCTPTPHSQIWTTGSLHLFGPSLVPTTNTSGITAYAVAHCDTAGANCSSELIVEMAKWGDVVRPFTGATQPNFGDINAIVQKFSNLASAPSMPRADLVGPQAPGTPNTPNQAANFSDVSNGVSAFSGLPYPYTVSACP